MQTAPLRYDELAALYTKAQNRIANLERISRDQRDRIDRLVRENAGLLHVEQAWRSGVVLPEPRGQAVG